MAHAIQHKDGERARTAMLQIMEQALLEMGSIWAFQDETSPGSTSARTSGRQLPDPSRCP